MSAINRCSVVFLALVVSCATSASSGAVPADGVPQERRANVISADELHDLPILQMDALRAIHQLRPMFFRSTGPLSFADGSAGNVHVSVDFGPLQPVAQLSSFNTLTFVEVRYLDTSEAQLHFGLKANSGPVILLLTHK